MINLEKIKQIKRDYDSGYSMDELKQSYSPDLINNLIVEGLFE